MVGLSEQIWYLSLINLSKNEAVWAKKDYFFGLGLWGGLKKNGLIQSLFFSKAFKIKYRFGVNESTPTVKITPGFSVSWKTTLLINFRGASFFFYFFFFLLTAIKPLP